MIGITLMVVGVLAFVVGIIIFFYSKEKKEVTQNGHPLEKIIEIAVADGVLTSNERKIIQQLTTENNLDFNEVISEVENQISTLNTDSETELIDYNKKNGDDFEKFVVQKFDRRFFTIKEWAGDKYVNGNYAKTTPQPDILLEFSLKQKTVAFSVECKWRKSLYKNGIEFAKAEQFQRYKNFQDSMNIPVFVAIGIGGKGMLPERFYIIPLSETDNNYIHISKLNKYEKDIQSNFFFDMKTNELK